MIYVLFVMDYTDANVFETKFVTTDIALLKDQVEFLKEIKLDHYVEVWTINGLYKGRLDAVLLN
jgi:hypothetical protein